MNSPAVSLLMIFDIPPQDPGCCSGGRSHTLWCIPRNHQKCGTPRKLWRGVPRERELTAQLQKRRRPGQAALAERIGRVQSFPTVAEAAVAAAPAHAGYVVGTWGRPSTRRASAVPPVQTGV